MRVAIPADETAQIWALSFQDRASAPCWAAAMQQRRGDHLAGCGIAFLDLVETADGDESLRCVSVCMSRVCVAHVCVGAASAAVCSV